MLVYTPTTGRAESIQRETLVAYPHTHLLIHTEREAEEYRAAGVEQRISITGNPPVYCGKSHSMAWAYERAAPGQWLLFLDDDISRFTALPDPMYATSEIPRAAYNANPEHWNAAFGTPVKDIHSLWLDTVQRADCNLVGFSPTPNPFFRLRKWGHRGIVRGWMLAIRKVAGRQLRICNQDDVYHSIDHLRADGAVLINRFVYAHGKQMVATQAGGMGPPAERRQVRALECAQMQRAFPDLIGVKMKRYGKVHVAEPYLK